MWFLSRLCGFNKGDRFPFDAAVVDGELQIFAEFRIRFFLLFSQSFVGLIRIAGETHNPKEHFAGGDIAKWTRLDEGECVCSNANVGPALVGVCVWCTLSNVIALYIFAMSLRCALSLCRQKSFDQIPHNPLLLVLRFAAGRRPKIGVDTPSGQNALSSEQRDQR